MVINSNVHVIHTELLRLPAPAIVVNNIGAVRAPAATLGDAAEFLDVDVDEISRRSALVAVAGATRGPDPDPGETGSS